MNLYYVYSADVHTHGSNSYYEPEESCNINELVLANSRSQARYLAWMQHAYRNCYMDMFYETTFDHIWKLHEYKQDPYWRNCVVTNDKQYKRYWNKVIKKHELINQNRERCTCERN